MVSQMKSLALLSESKPNDKKPKYKKDAFTKVDYEEEFKNDPKFKTELCVKFTSTGFCRYGNKCRFAHGKDQLFNKSSYHPKYRKTDCLTFHTVGFCNYGQRCHFRHNENIKLSTLGRCYYSYLLKIVPSRVRPPTRRLRAFQQIVVQPTLPRPNHAMSQVMSKVGQKKNSQYSTKEETKWNFGCEGAQPK